MKPWHRVVIIIVNIIGLAGLVFLLRAISDKKPATSPEPPPRKVTVMLPNPQQPQAAKKPSLPATKAASPAKPRGMVDLDDTAFGEPLVMDTETEFDDPDEIPEPPPRHELRLWQSANGKFFREARFVRYKSGVVTLRMESGEELDVEAAKLSEEDRAWIEARRKQ